MQRSLLLRPAPHFAGRGGGRRDDKRKRDEFVEMIKGKGVFGQPSETSRNSWKQMEIKNWEVEGVA